MTEKERLEELKKMRLLYEVCFVDDYASAIDDVTADFDLLIKRVQELEEFKKTFDELDSSYVDLQEQNKRYREVIEDIGNVWKLTDSYQEYMEAIHDIIKDLEGEKE